MARLFREIAVRAGLATLQAGLATEIAAIQSERGDSVTLAAPESWYAYERDPMRPGNGVEVNLFCDDISLEKSGMSLWSAASPRHPAQWTGVVVCRLGFANRDQSKESIVVEKWWRYEAALLRTFLNSKNLGQANVITIMDYQTSNPPRGLVSSDKQRAAVVEVRIPIRVNESHASETVASGGVPPSATLET